MKNTWYIENSHTSAIYGYYSYATDAKEYLKRLAAERPIEHNAGVLRVVKLVGPYFGEGRHEYYCHYNDIKDKFIYIRH